MPGDFKTYPPSRRRGQMPMQTQQPSGPAGGGYKQMDSSRTFEPSGPGGYDYGYLPSEDQSPASAQRRRNIRQDILDAMVEAGSWEDILDRPAGQMTAGVPGLDEYIGQNAGTDMLDEYVDYDQGLSEQGRRAQLVLTAPSMPRRRR